MSSAKKQKRQIQPFLLCTSSDAGREGQFFIYTDGNAIPVGVNALVAFDILLKLYYCFDIEYSADLKNFWDHITNVVMEMNQPKGCCAALSVTF